MSALSIAIIIGAPIAASGLVGLLPQKGLAERHAAERSPAWSAT